MAEKVIISFEVDNAGAISKINQTKKAIGEDVPAAAAKAASGFSRLQSTLATVGVAFAALGVARLARTLMDIGGQVIQTGAKFETMAIQMRAVTGSAESAQIAMDWITDFTASTPYQLEQVTNAFVRMKAMGLDPMDGTMQAVADMTSYLGGSMETMNSIVLALGKSFTVGKMSMEELRMLAERGVPVFDILAKKLGVTNEKIVEMSSKGQLGRDAIQLLIEGMGELAGGASQSLMESYTGLWSNLQDHITLAMKELSEGGILDAAKDGLRSLVGIMVDLRESGKLAEWGKQVGDALRSLADQIPSIIGFVKDLFKNLLEIIPVAIELGKIWAGIWVVTKIQAFSAALATLPALFTSAATAARGLQAAMGPITAAFVAAGLIGEGLATVFDRMNRSLDQGRNFEAQMRALAEAINLTYGSVQNFNAATGLSLDQAAEYIDKLK
jgi:tape measure domain-containing protein